MNIVAVLGCILVVTTVYCNALDPLTSAPSHQRNIDRQWRNQAVHLLWEERKEMGRTPLVSFEIEGMPYLDFRFKNESATKTGNLKHRFSWALYMWALTEGFINKDTTIYEASSGNTATSEAYMAKVIGVQFVAVVPDTTEQAKIDNIEKWGGKVHKADISKTFEEAEKLAKETNGFYMNQFGNAFLAEEFHESGGSDFKSMNVMHEILVQLNLNASSAPHFFIHTAGTGGTISSVGRYVQKYGVNTEVILADTQYSMYYDYVINGRFSTENDSAASLWIKPGMAGTGYGYAGPGIRGKTTSLLPAVIDIAYKVPDLASTAAMHVLKENKINGGTSTGLNFITSLSVAATEKEKAGDQKLRIITLLCDSSSLYESSYYNLTWIKEKFEPHGGIPIFECWKAVIKRAMKEGFDPIETGNKECAIGGSAIPPSAIPSSNPENPLPSSPEAPLVVTPHSNSDSSSNAPQGSSPASKSPSETSSSPGNSASPLRPRTSRQPMIQSSPSGETVFPTNTVPSSNPENSVPPSSETPLSTPSHSNPESSGAPQGSSPASETLGPSKTSQQPPMNHKPNGEPSESSASDESVLPTNSAPSRGRRHA